MSEGLDVIVVDDDREVCDVVAEMIENFYAWGEVLSFTHAREAISYCLGRKTGAAIFVLDVFIGEETAFGFLDAIEGKFPTAHKDSVIITGYASSDIVNMCFASGVAHLLEKPIKPFALELAIRSIVGRYLRLAQDLGAFVRTQECSLSRLTV